MILPLSALWSVAINMVIVGFRGGGKDDVVSGEFIDWFASIFIRTVTVLLFTLKGRLIVFISVMHNFLNCKIRYLPSQTVFFY